MPKLNPTQRKLIKEIEELQELFHLNPHLIVTDPEPASWTPRLQLARNQLIRSQVIMDYTFIDEFLNCIIARFYFGKQRTFPDLWRTKKFKIFNYHILEELSLLKKLALVRTISSMPRAVREDIERLNALRNGLAHAFFPENLRKSKPKWKGKNIFSMEGISQYQEDVSKIIDYFVPELKSDLNA